MWTPSLLKNKLQALTIHLGLSLVILLAFVALIWFVWYPAPLFFTDGGWQGLRIMALIDLVLGPALTFLVYNPAKTRRALGFDFACIGLAQGIALTYGAIQVESVRPWAVAYQDGRFHVHAQTVFADQEISPDGWQPLGDGPVYHVYTRAPKTDDEVAGVAAFGAFAGVDENGLHFLYEPLAPHLAEVQAAALDMPALAAADAAFKADYEALRRRHAGERLWFLPLQGYFANAVVAMNAQGRFVGAIYRDPPALPTAAAGGP